MLPSNNVDGTKGDGARSNRVNALGGPTNYGLSVGWIVAVFIGWVLTMAGLSALQNYVNAGTLPGTVPNWWPEANFARLGSGTIFRFPWWTWAWTIITFVVLVLAFATNVIHQARIPLVAWSMVAALLNMMAGNEMLNVAAIHVSPATTSAARCAAAGFIISAVSFLALTYSVGLLPSGHY